MKFRRLSIAFILALTASACESAMVPTAAPDSPSFAVASTSGHFRSFKIPTANSQPRHIALGSDGNMWFTEGNVGQIGVIDAKGKITEFVIKDVSISPDDIVAGPDGALWFTIPNGFPNAIGRITTSGQLTRFSMCTPQECSSFVPEGITSGPDGNLWFTESTRNAVVKMTPSGVFTFYTIPTIGASATGITVGPDGALWFAEFGTKSIGRIDLAGNITEFPGVTGNPDRITSGPDGNLWFTEPFPFDSRIGRITTSGAITEFQLASGAQPRDIVAGPDGNLWFTENGAGQLAQITPTGTVSEVQAVKGGPWGIGRGADSAIWLTQFDGNQISRFTLTR